MIDNADAPTEYRFPMDGATHLTANPDGGLTVWNGATVVSTVAAPWAYDANGVDLPTTYRIDGTTIVQTVNHHGAAYPVVADPWWNPFSWDWDSAWRSVTRHVSVNWQAVVAGFGANTLTQLVCLAGAGAIGLTVAGPGGALAFSKGAVWACRALGFAASQATAQLVRR